MLMLPFGETVLAWRLARGLTQAELARGARIPRPNLSAIERGDRDVTLRTLRALAVALDVQPGLLADGRGPETGGAPLGRAELERIADAAATGAILADERESRLARRLAAVTTQGRSRRAGDRAYLLLKAAETAKTVASLVDRVGNRRRRS